MVSEQEQDSEFEQKFELKFELKFEQFSDMEIAPVGLFDSRHGDNTEVLLALLTQNKELEGETLGQGLALRGLEDWPTLGGLL